MSQARLIYPLLDGFLLGDAISEHDGVRCYPAFRQKTGETYIVKVISFPASRVQMDALLFSGAYPDHEAALRYFRDLAQETVNQVQILSQLSRQEGFCAYEGHQLISAADGSGYEVYLLSRYRSSLPYIQEKSTLTHRAALELGLDLCAALAACRRAGYLYVDLRPDNLFFDQKQGWQIGDLGFLPLHSLAFAGLPRQYRSVYTAPEMGDDLAPLNNTLDIYALGLLLTGLFNGGSLPKDSKAAPLYADYELTDILSKACHKNPDRRWQDPTQFAQALIGYMQRNEVRDTPLSPIPHTDSFVPEEADFLPPVTDEELQKEIALLPENEVRLMEAMSAETDDTLELLAQANALLRTQEPEPEAPRDAPRPVEKPTPTPDLQSKPLAAAPEAIDCPRERRPFPWKKLLGVLAAALLVLLGIRAKSYYDNVYIQHISQLQILQQGDTVTVQVFSDVDESLLTVLCTDSYGNVRRCPVAGGIATFTGLAPDTHYTIRLTIRGNHKLTGSITDGFTTAQQTQILSFSAGIGPEDGSVLLTLATSGPAVEVWTVTYRSENGDAMATTFRGNHMTLTGLQVGQRYTFTLSATGHTLSGNTQVSYTASNIILAQNLAITACGGGSLTAQWECPADFVPVEGWAVRCFNSAGYDQTVITYEPHYTFTGLDHSVPCTVHVTYAGMTQSVSTNIGANPITVEAFNYAITEEDGLTIRWTHSGAAPEGGWNVLCVIDGKSIQVNTAEPFITAKVLPGSSYRIYVSAADGSTVLGGESSYVISEVAPFVGFGVDAETLTAQISGKTVTITAPADTAVESTDRSVYSLCLLRTAEGMLVSAFEDTFLWNTIWEGNVCTLLLPALPDVPGNYVLSIYLDGGWLAEVEFTVE